MMAMAFARHTAGTSHRSRSGYWAQYRLSCMPRAALAGRTLSRSQESQLRLLRLGRCPQCTARAMHGAMVLQRHSTAALYIPRTIVVPAVFHFPAVTVC
jgi:hypothetical protein